MASMAHLDTSLYTWSDNQRMRIGLTIRDKYPTQQEVWASWAWNSYRGNCWKLKSTFFNKGTKGKGSSTIAAEEVDLSTLPTQVPNAIRKSGDWKKYLLDAYRLQYKDELDAELKQKKEELEHKKKVKEELERKKEADIEDDAKETKTTKRSGGKTTKRTSKKTSTQPGKRNSSTPTPPPNAAVPTNKELEEMFYDFGRDISAEENRQIATYFSKVQGLRIPVPAALFSTMRERARKSRIPYEEQKEEEQKEEEQKEEEQKEEEEQEEEQASKRRKLTGAKHHKRCSLHLFTPELQKGVAEVLADREKLRQGGFWKV
ncbi:unnamed protein product [Alternaria sp. RS040]